MSLYFRSASFLGRIHIEFLNLPLYLGSYNFGGHPSPTVDPLMKYVGVGLSLTEQEKENLKAFLLTLSDESFMNNPDFANPFNQ